MLLLMLSVSDIHLRYSVRKPFLFLYQCYRLKCSLRFLGKFDIQKCLFTVSQNVLFHGIKILERKKNAIGNVEQIILSFQPGYTRKKKELQSQNEGLWCFCHILRKLVHSSAVVQFYLFSVFHMKLFENVLYWP